MKCTLCSDLVFRELLSSANEPTLADEPTVDEPDDTEPGLGIWDNMLTDEPDEGEDDQDISLFNYE